MVFYSKQADEDMDNIRAGLLHWKIELREDFVLSYVAEIKRQCELIPKNFYHANTVYPEHKKYGAKVHKYRRNAHTTWYIIYNTDSYNNIFVNKIISNHTTTG